MLLSSLSVGSASLVPATSPFSCIAAATAVSRMKLSCSVCPSPAQLGPGWSLPAAPLLVPARCRPRSLMAIRMASSSSTSSSFGRGGGCSRCCCCCPVVPPIRLLRCS
uniref:Putative secreted protein n=1 Tax=Anopheles triannulatus TaxID=58253 RepID=A0A2M4B432_9DIPT